MMMQLTIVIFTRNFVDEAYCSGLDINIQTPLSITTPSAPQIMSDRILKVLSSVLLILKSFIKPLKRKSEASAEPMPTITLNTCAITKILLCFAKNSIMFSIYKIIIPDASLKPQQALGILLVGRSGHSSFHNIQC